jgi:Predicted membrane protein (DUF2207)/Ankyrin repeats (many copies)
VFFRSILVLIFAFGLIGLASASDDSRSRILSFQSNISVAKNTDLAVRERMKISNRDGFFDSGFHRYLSLKRVTAQRKKPGWFESIHAKVDGQDASVTIEQSDIFHIGILAEGGKWGRGEHTIELNYVAKNQFTDYGDYQDLNQDITGGWAVPIQSATVEMNFPAGVPHQLSISADTGNDGSFQFNCTKTELASGIKFETTHPLAPSERLFISARFMQAGYFVPDVSDRGWRAVFAKHPSLSPIFWAFGTLLVLTTIAYALSPKDSRGYAVAPGWIRVLLLVSLPGSAALALRLVYEQTVMTWRNGEQMVGFALAHAYIFFYLPMLLSLVLAHFALACVLAVTLARALRRVPTPKWNWLTVVALALCIVTVYMPYNFWLTTTITIAGPGTHGPSFLMMAAADDKLPLAKVLIAKGISPNAMAGGSTALDVACSSRNLDVARFLIEEGADLSHASSCANLDIKGSSSDSQ